MTCVCLLLGLYNHSGTRGRKEGQATLSTPPWRARQPYQPPHTASVASSSLSLFLSLSLCVPRAACCITDNSRRVYRYQLHAATYSKGRLSQRQQQQLQQSCDAALRQEKSWLVEARISAGVLCSLVPSSSWVGVWWWWGDGVKEMGVVVVVGRGGWVERWGEFTGIVGLQ